MLKSERWEQGSEFHWSMSWPNVAARNPWEGTSIFWGSGRDAFRALLNHGQMTRGWRRLWIPAYFCQDVAAAFVSTGIPVAAYSDGPQRPDIDWAGIDFQPGDVILRVNFFGLRTLASAKPLQAAGFEVIDDHTHDPWSDSARNSDADWCIASLRKTLPIPDGGVLWSPIGHVLPTAEAVTTERSLASLEKLAGMLLKSLYLAQHHIGKDVFRRLALSGEEHIASGDISGMPDWTRSLLGIFPVEDWRSCRQVNHQTLRGSLADLDWLQVLSAPTDSHCPFSGIVLFDTPARRRYVRQNLIEAKVYPAVLWPLDAPVVAGIPPEFVGVSERMLSIHCDMRYGESDMLRVAELIRKFGAAHVG